MKAGKRTRAPRESGSARVPSELLRYRDRYIVVDTSTHFVFIGKLVEASDDFVTLADADIHDRRESPSTNEKYIMDSKKLGVRPNRQLVHIRYSEVVSVSALDDVIEY